MSLRSFAMLQSGGLPAFGTVCSTLSTFTPNNFHEPIHIYIYIYIFSCSHAYLKDLSLGEKCLNAYGLHQTFGFVNGHHCHLGLSLRRINTVISRSFSSAVLCYFPMRAQQPCGWSARCIPSLAHPPHHSCPNLSCHPLRWPQCATVPLPPTTPDSHAVWNHIITSIWLPWRYKKHWALCSFDKECLTCDMLLKPVRSNKYCSDALSNAKVNKGRGQNMFL